MAKDFDVTDDGDYHETNTYREASREERRRMNRYKKECGISDKHMFLLCARRDLERVPKEQRTNSDTTSKVVLVVAVLLFWNSMSAAMGSESGKFDMVLWAVAMLSFIMAIVVYFTGILNPYRRAVRKVDKLLKEMGEVPDYETWCETHPLKG